MLDSGGNVFYALMPASARSDENGAQRYFVAVLDARSLKVLHNYTLPNAHLTLPTLVSDSSRQNLFIAFDDNYWQRLVTQADGALAPSGSVITLKAPFPTTPAPYIDGQGDIVDGLRVLDPQGGLIREIRPDTILDSPLQQKFAPLTAVKGSQSHYNGTIPAAFAADRIVFTVGWDRENDPVPSAGVTVYDLRAGRVIASFLSPLPVAAGYAGESGVPSVHLTPDGKRVVLEQYDWRPVVGEESRRARFRAGKIAIYDADSGLPSGTVTVEPSRSESANGRVINFFHDSRYLYYWFDRRLFVVDLDETRVVSSAALPNGFDPTFVVSYPLQ